MKITDIPSRIPLPFAANAGSPYIRGIPVTTATPGAASYDQGFPPLTFTPPSSGGKLPLGKDFNGIFNIITAWVRWLNAGAPIAWNSDFASAIGGYPRGCVILGGGIPGVFYESLVDDNLLDPNTDTTQWAPAYDGRSIKDLTIDNGKIRPTPPNTVKGRVLSGIGAMTDLTAYDLNGLLDRVGETVFFDHPNFDTTLYTLYDGGTLSRTTDARLFAKVSSLIGTQGAKGWGAGDGSTTFTKPDRRGYFPRGYDPTNLVNPDVLAFGTPQTDAFQGHTHTIPLRQTSGGGNTVAASDGTGSVFSTTATTTVDGGSGTPRTSTETRPSNVSVYWCGVR